MKGYNYTLNTINHTFSHGYSLIKLKVNQTFEKSSTSAFSFDFEALKVQDVMQSLNSIDPKKAPGPDGLDPFLLKVAAPVIAEPIIHIFNMSISFNQVPAVWKQAYITPLFKAGDQYDMNNFRPISNLPVLSKCWNL